MPLPFPRRRDVLAAGSFLLAGAGRARAAELRPFTVVLDWLLNADHAGLFAAVATGACARAGLAVRLVAPSDPSAPPRLLAAGEADLAVGYGSQLPILVAGGLPVMRVATVIATPLDVMMALPGRGIRTLADLRGRTIGYSVPGLDEATVAAMLGSVGLRLADVRLVDVNYALVQSLLARQVDAVVGVFRNAEVLQVEMQGIAPVLFSPADHGVPPFDELLLMARAGRARSGPVAAFVRALAEGVAAVRAGPAGLFGRFARAHPELDTAYDRRSWDATVPLLVGDPARLDAARYERFAEWCVAEHLIPTAPPLQSYAI